MNTLKTPYFSDWPKIDSAIAKDSAMEAAIAEIVAQMTLEEKIGQMVQPNLRGVTPQQAKEYKGNYRCRYFGHPVVKRFCQFAVTQTGRTSFPWPGG